MARQAAVRSAEAVTVPAAAPQAGSAMAEAFVDSARETVQWLENSTELEFSIIPMYPDYHPEHPGGKPEGGRSLDPGLFSYAKLGEWQTKVAKSRRSAHLKITDTTLGGGTGFLDSETQKFREENDLRGCGAGLVGPIIKALLDLGVSLHVNAPATDLVIENGRVKGVRVEIDGVESTVRASFRRSATCLSRRSPIGWPKQSLTFLNRSRSTQRTATCLPASARSSAWRRRSW